MEASPCAILKTKDQSKNCYNFTPSASFILSLTSGIDSTSIEAVSVYSRSWLRYIPWYSAKKGGGAITLGGRKSQTMTFTENFFSRATMSTISWLRLSAHEVIHIKHAKQFGSLFFYLLAFAFQYMRHGHDNCPLEIEADIGRNNFDRFVQFINREIGYNKLVELIESHLSEDKKIETINDWWISYSESINATIV